MEEVSREEDHVSLLLVRLDENLLERVERVLAADRVLRAPVAIVAAGRVVTMRRGGRAAGEACGVGR